MGIVEQHLMILCWKVAASYCKTNRLLRFLGELCMDLALRSMAELQCRYKS